MLVRNISDNAQKVVFKGSIIDFNANEIKEVPEYFKGNLPEFLVEHSDFVIGEVEHKRISVSKKIRKKKDSNDDSDSVTVRFED